MREFLRKLIDVEYDGINFYINEEDLQEVSCFHYAERGEKKPGSDMGDLYDIIITRSEPTELPERFQAILSSPPHYISRMLNDGFVGVIGRCTTTSEKVMDAVFESMTNDVQEILDDGE